MKRFQGLVVCGAAMAAAMVAQPATACTRLVFLGDDNVVITARSMDWRDEMPTNLYILPRGMERNGEAGPTSIRWTAKYGSVVATGLDVSTTDGVNEKGLAANVLWLAESQYPDPRAAKKPLLTIAAWAQYALDNYATVAEAVEALSKEPFVVVTDNVPGMSKMTTLHLSLSGASGDSAIIEYVDGKQVIHHGRQYQVMTNSPIFQEQLALGEYWKSVDGANFLPGSNRSPDRFARASFYVNAIPKSGDPDRLLASVFGVIRNVSVPLGISVPDHPEISSTRWRTLVDHKRRIYFFESAAMPNSFWVDLKKLDFSKETGHVKRLDMGKDASNVYAGETSAKFHDAKPFPFQGI